MSFYLKNDGKWSLITFYAISSSLFSLCFNLLYAFCSHYIVSAELLCRLTHIFTLYAEQQYFENKQFLQFSLRMATLFPLYCLTNCIAINNRRAKVWMKRNYEILKAKQSESKQNRVKNELKRITTLGPKWERKEKTKDNMGTWKHKIQSGSSL